MLNSFSICNIAKNKKNKSNNIVYIIIDVVPECLNLQLRVTKKKELKINLEFQVKKI